MFTDAHVGAVWRAAKGASRRVEVQPRQAKRAAALKRCGISDGLVGVWVIYFGKRIVECLAHFGGLVLQHGRVGCVVLSARDGHGVGQARVYDYGLNHIWADVECNLVAGCATLHRHTVDGNHRDGGACRGRDGEAFHRVFLPMRCMCVVSLANAGVSVPCREGQVTEHHVVAFAEDGDGVSLCRYHSIDCVCDDDLNGI